MVNSASSVSDPVGQIFTPLKWAKWAIEKGPYQDWLNGGIILDPTGGAGVFLEAFLSKATSDGRSISREMLERLFMVEIDSQLCTEAIDRIKKRYKVEIPDSNIVNDDFFSTSLKIRATSIVGNPPWINFTKLTDTYKAFIKPYYIRYGLVPDLRQVLWGGSRIDLAATVLAKCAQDHCADSASMVFYLPLSLFMNDGAHQALRTLSFKHHLFGIEELHDLTQQEIFQGICTRYCLAKMKFGQATRFPIDYWIHQSGRDSIRCQASTLSTHNNTLTLADPSKRPTICVPRCSFPRQGVNTCGANALFFFHSSKTNHDGVAFISNEKTNAIVEEELVLPLIVGKNWENENVHKYVFLPHDRATGKPLEQAELEHRYPCAWRYLGSIADKLQARKGKMLGQQIAKGRWWSMLGVGQYTFAPHKIVWQAYGKSDFKPKLFSGNWIPNQSLQAYMPFDKSATATEILKKLKDANLTKHLRLGQMAGTASWAQPGKIKAFLEPIDDERQLNLF